MGEVIQLFREETIKIPRSPEFLKAVKEFGDYLNSLSLSVEENDELVRLAVKQIEILERSVYLCGMDFGIDIGIAIAQNEL